MAGTDSISRRAALESLYSVAYSELRDAAYVAQPTLTAGNVETLLAAVARLINSYDGPDEDAQAFTKWAVSAIVQPGAALLATLNTLKGEHSEAVRKGIRSVLKNCDDLGVIPPGKTVGTIGEIEAETWWKVFINLDHWLTPAYSNTPGRSPARLSTRLRAYARDQARGWRTEQLRRRKKFRTINYAVAVEQRRAEAPTSRKPNLNEIEQRVA